MKRSMSTSRQSASGQRPDFESLEARCLLSRIELPVLAAPVHPPVVGVFVRILPGALDPLGPSIDASPGLAMGMGWGGPQSGPGGMMRAAFHPAIFPVILPADSSAASLATGVTESPGSSTGGPWLGPQADMSASLVPQIRPALHAEMMSVFLPWASTWPGQPADAMGNTGSGRAAPWLGPWMRPTMHVDVGSGNLPSDSTATGQSTGSWWGADPGTGAPPEHARFDHPGFVYDADHPGPPVAFTTAPDPSFQGVAPRVHPRVDPGTDLTVGAPPAAQAATMPIALGQVVPPMPSAVNDEATISRPQAVRLATVVMVPAHSVPGESTERAPAATGTPTHEESATAAAPGTATPSAPGTVEEDALEALETPAPQTAGLIAEVATLDGVAIDATVARLLDRFRDLATPLESPATGIPSPLMVAAAVVSIELSRRWIVRRRRGGTTIAVRREDRLALHGFS
jgi:hypothetical protein